MFIQEYCDSFCQTGRHYRVNIDVYRLEKESRKSFITCWYLVLAEAPVSSASGEDCFGFYLQVVQAYRKLKPVKFKDTSLHIYADNR